MDYKNSEKCRKWYMKHREKEYFKKRRSELARKYRLKKKRENINKINKHVTAGHLFIGQDKRRQRKQQKVVIYSDSDSDYDEDWNGSSYEDYAKHTVFQHPFSMVIAGPSGSGKTCWITRLLKNKEVMIQPNVEEVLWFHGQDQLAHSLLKEQFPYLQIIKGLPDVNTFDPMIPRLIIVDDQMNQLSGNIIADLFTKGSHHTNTSVILTVQNIFSRNKEMRDISLNAHYMVLLKNPRDKLQVRNLDRQMYPGKHGFLTSCYEYATRKPYGYILLITNQSTDEKVRIRSHIFPGEENIFFGPSL